jgi:hypothetical protein
LAAVFFLEVALFFAILFPPRCWSEVSINVFLYIASIFQIFFRVFTSSMNTHY